MPRQCGDGKSVAGLDLGRCYGADARDARVVDSSGQDCQAKEGIEEYNLVELLSKNRNQDQIYNPTMPQTL